MRTVTGMGRPRPRTMHHATPRFQRALALVAASVRPAMSHFSNGSLSAISESQNAVW